jgi:Protein of unknown function (DUF3141)
MTDTSALAQSQQRLLETSKENRTYAAGQATLLGHWSLHHVQAIARRQIEAARQTATALSALAPQFLVPKTGDALFEYANDSAQRWILFLDTLCQRGEAVIAREKEAFAPVLAFDYDMIVDGRKLDRPVNYALVRIHPPKGMMPPREDGRPWVIIDPRAGHGSGIGGFKSESVVGVALRDGHPVYFVIFFPEPEPGQTLADVCAAEAAFLRAAVDIGEQIVVLAKPVLARIEQFEIEHQMFRAARGPGADRKRGRGHGLESARPFCDSRFGPPPTGQA